jgi:hypothetical protein
VLPIAPRPLTKGNVLSCGLLWKTHGPTAFWLWLDWIMFCQWDSVKFQRTALCPMCYVRK